MASSYLPDFIKGLDELRKLRTEKTPGVYLRNKEEEAGELRTQSLVSLPATPRKQENK